MEFRQAKYHEDEWWGGWEGLCVLPPFRGIKINEAQAELTKYFRQSMQPYF